MAAKVSAIVYSTKQGVPDSKFGKTISDISATATPAQIKAFAQSLNSLSTNSYVETYRIERLNCDTAEPTPSKPVPTLTLASATATISDITSAMASAEGLYENAITYNGDGVLSVATSYADIVASVDEDFLYVAFIGEGTSGTVTLYASEGVTYSATSVTFTINA